MSEQQPKYSATAAQTVEYKKEQNGKTFIVGNVIAGLPDAAILEYAKSIEQTNTQKDEENYEFVTNDEDALERFWRSVCVGTVNLKTRDGRELSEMENYAPQEGRETTRWQDVFLDKYYADANAVANHLLSVLPIAGEALAEKGGEDDQFFIDDVDAKTHRLKVPFGGKMIEVAHELKSGNAAQQKRFKEITKNKNWRKTDEGNMSLVVRTQAEELLALYEQVRLSVTNYDGEPPAHHKLFVVRRHFQQNAEIVEKN